MSDAGHELICTPACFLGFRAPLLAPTTFFALFKSKGYEEWRLDGFTRLHPAKLDSCSDFHPINHKNNSVTTKRGDILYIPRGLWHSAKACSEASLHLSVGIHCPGRNRSQRPALVKTANDIAELRRDPAAFRDGSVQLSRRGCESDFGGFFRSFHADGCRKIDASINLSVWFVQICPTTIGFRASLNANSYR